MSDLLYAPWTDAQVESLNRLQNSNYVHPYTCEKRLSSGDASILIATHDGWVCLDCDYRQSWASESAVLLSDALFRKPRLFSDVLRDAVAGEKELEAGGGTKYRIAKGDLERV